MGVSFDIRWHIIVDRKTNKHTFNILHCIQMIWGTVIHYVAYINTFTNVSLQMMSHTFNTNLVFLLKLITTVRTSLILVKSYRFRSFFISNCQQTQLETIYA